MKNIKWIAFFVAVTCLVATAAYQYGRRSADAPTMTGSAAKAERKVLYYRNPMGLPDTSPVAKKDSMGMDYVPVYEGDEPQQAGAVSISPDRVQKLGVKSEAATLRRLDQTLRVTGLVAVDERRIHTVAPKFEGWIEKLYVNASGQSVAKGQALFDVYSPELVSAQREYAIAVQGEAALQQADGEARGSMSRLAEASLARLGNWDITGAEIACLKQGCAAKRNLSYRALVSGVVLEKRAVQGMRFMPGESLFQIADLSSVWVLAEVPESEIGRVKQGGAAQVEIGAYPDRQFKGTVTFIYPTMNPATRTVQVRIELANPGGLLKPAMYASVILPVGDSREVLTVPTSAVIDSGTRQVVLVQQGEGRFAPRNVRLGNRSGEYVEVQQGLTEGERVVTSALFLIDAESNLKAALSGLAPNAGNAAPPAGQAADSVPPDVPSKTQPEAVSGGKSETRVAASNVGHQVEGVLDEINDDGSVTITHKPIQSLGWPGMSMDFELANPSLVSGIAPGSAITFEIVERAPSDWVITKMRAAAPAHKGH
ncbi:MAG: efflux RND transporter periplasmic adaptor subunit [Gallionella sp.]|nr:efflux RND transporter periplasmic adaptor subunit [Gallionella sp.]MDD4947223.1 efflux RND transporter periplasmic adaptor subunit [Gallionella sp.]